MPRYADDSVIRSPAGGGNNSSDKQQLHQSSSSTIIIDNRSRENRRPPVHPHKSSSNRSRDHSPPDHQTRIMSRSSSHHQMDHRQMHHVPPAHHSSSSSTRDNYHQSSGPPGHHREPRDYDDYSPSSGHHAATSTTGSSSHRPSLPYKILCVANLNSKIADSSIKEALYHEFSRFGDVSVKVCHDSNERFAYCYFRSYEDAREARHAKYRMILFDKQVEIDPIYDRRTRSPDPAYHDNRAHAGPPPPVSRYNRGEMRPPGSPSSHHRNIRPPPERPVPPTGRIPYGSRDSSSSRRIMSDHPADDRYPPHHHQAPPHHQRDSSRNYDMRDSRSGGDHRSSSSHDLHHNNTGHHSHHTSGTGDKMRSDRNPVSADSNNRNNNNGNSNPSKGTSSTSAISGSNVNREKFPNYLHHIPPEEDDKATRTLFVGNLEVTISDGDLRRIFERYGVVEDIDVKRPAPGAGNAYAFIKFLNLDMAHRAKVEMSGQYIGKFQCKIGYGKATPTTRIWVGGLGSWTSLATLEREFDRFGAIRKIDFVKGDNHAYISYDSIDAAQAASQEMRGFPLGGPEKRLRVDFADPGPYSTSGNPATDTTTTGSPVVTSDVAPVDNRTSPRRYDAYDNSSPDQNNRSRRTDSYDYHESNRSPNGHQKQQRLPASTSSSVQKRHSSSLDASGVDHLNNSGADENYGSSVAKRSRVILSPAHDPDPSVTSPRIIRTSSSSVETSSVVCDDRTPGVKSSLDIRLSDVIKNNGGGGNSGESVVMYEDVISLSDLIKVTPEVWTGAFILKNSAFASKMNVISGASGIVDQLMKPSSGGVKKGDDPLNESESAESISSETSSPEVPLLRITQRLRLDPPKLEDVTRRMSAAGSTGYCLMITTSLSPGDKALNINTIGSGEDGTDLQNRSLKNLVSYLKTKEAAGVINLTSVTSSSSTSTSITDASCVGYLYAFPPCPFSLELIRRYAPNFDPSAAALSSGQPVKEDFLLVIVVKGSVP